MKGYGAMHNVVIDKPYEFVPPHRGRWWPWLLQRSLRWRLRREYGLVRVECRGGERLRASLRAGDGVLIAPNHCRPCDPEVVHECAKISCCKSAGQSGLVKG